MEKENLSKVEKFAEQIIRLAAEEGLSVTELRESTYLARNLANNAGISIGCIQRSYLLQYGNKRFEKRDYSGL